MTYLMVDRMVVRSYVRSFLRSIIPSFLRSFVPSFLRSTIHTFRDCVRRWRLTERENLDKTERGILVSRFST